MTNDAHRTRRALRSAIAVGATLAATVATAPLAFAQTDTNPTSAVSDVYDLVDSATGETGAGVELPADAPVNFSVSDVSENGAPILTFLSSAVDLASQFLTVDTETGAANLVNELAGLLDGSSSGSFDADKLPDFLKQGKDGVISGDTSGVAPGEYTIKGTMTDGNGREQPIEFTMSVGGGSDDSGNSDDTDDSDKDGGSGASQGTGDNDKGDDSSSDSGESSNSGEVSYEDTTITTGEEATVKPEGNTDGKVFVAVDSPDWAKVDPKTGAVKLAPGNGTAAGENQITVGHTATSLQDVIQSKGAPSDLDKTDFIATVKRGNHKADAVAEAVNSGEQGQFDNAVNSDADSTATQPGTDSSDADSTATQPGTDSSDTDSTATQPGTDTSDTASGERPSARQGTPPGYVDNAAQSDQLPVTGINAGALGVMAAVALLAGAGMMLFGLRRSA